MKVIMPLILFLLSAQLTSCKKKGCTDPDAQNFSEEAKKDDGSCTFYDIPDTYDFKDISGNSTVSYQGQIDRLNQLEELTAYMKAGTTTLATKATMEAMFHNTGDNGGGNFTFSSSKRLSDKCLFTDTAMFIGWMAELADASLNNGTTATSGQAGVLTSGTSKYLVNENGQELAQLVEKGLMGAVFFYQATNVYFGSDKMDVDNTTPVDPSNGEYFTDMEHHWDEAFGYFGAPTDFLTNTSGLRFWAKYCNSRNAQLNSNAIMMNAFLAGRTAIANNDLVERDKQIKIISEMWEKISAAQAVAYLEGAKDNFGTDNAVFMHELSEAFAFIHSIKYAPTGAKLSNSQISNLLVNVIGTDFWTVTIADLTNAINEINTAYSL